MKNMKYEKRYENEKGRGEREEKKRRGKEEKKRRRESKIKKRIIGYALRNELAVFSKMRKRG